MLTTTTPDKQHTITLSSDFLQYFIDRNKSTVNHWIKAELCSKSSYDNITVGEYRSMVAHWITGDMPRICLDSMEMVLFGTTVKLYKGHDHDRALDIYIDGIEYSLGEIPLIGGQ